MSVHRIAPPALALSVMGVAALILALTPAARPAVAQDWGPTIAVVAPPGGAITLNWDPDSAASSYRIYLTPESQPLNFSVQQTVSQPVGGQVSTALVAGLTPGVVYLIQVRSVDPNGLETMTSARILPGPASGAPLPPPPLLLPPVPFGSYY